MTLETWLAFTAATIVLLVIPGPTILTVISYSITHGRYLGVRMLRGRVLVADAVETAPVPASRWKLFVNTYTVTALNPKGIIFFVAFLPQFLRPGGNVRLQLWTFAVTFVVLAAINAGLYAVFAASARRLLASARAQRRFNRVGGCLLAGAGVWALFARRAAVTA